MSENSLFFCFKYVNCGGDIHDNIKNLEHMRSAFFFQDKDMAGTYGNRLKNILRTQQFAWAMNVEMESQLP